MFEELADSPPLRLAAEALRARFGDSLLESSYERKELSIKVRTRDLLAVLRFLKDEHGFNALNDIIALDRFPRSGEGTKRFSILYQLYQFPGRLRIRIEIDVDDSEPVASVTPLFRSADWAEREIFDMFGLRFSGHPDLRRIYLAEDFAGHPLRKDFPLEG